MASRRNIIKTNIEANSSGFIQAMDEIKRSIASARIEFKNINELMKSSGNITDDLIEHKRLLQTEITNTEVKLEVLNKGLEDSIRIHGEESNITKIAREEVQKAQTHYLSLKNELEKVNNELEEQPTKLTKISENMQNLGTKIGGLADKFKWLSAGAFSVLGLSSKIAINFEDAFVGVQKTVSGTEEELQKIRNQIIQMSNKIPIATTELFHLAQTAGQLGIKTQNISKFTEIMAKLGTATNLSASEAGEAIATFVNVMGTLPENYEKVGSVLVRLGNNSKATEADIMAMAQRMAGAGATLKMSESAIFGLATALSSVGLEAEMGGTAISRIMNDFNRAASGVKTKYGTLDQYARIAGMSTQQFANILKVNAGEAVKQFIIGLGDVNRTGKGTIELLSELGVDEVRLTDTMLRLANASGTVDEYMKMADEEWIINNALTKEAQRKYADTASQIQILKNKLGELADSFGKLMLPTINVLVDKFGNLIKWFSNLSDGSKTAITSILLLTAGIFPLLKGIQFITETGSSLSTIYGWLENLPAAVTGLSSKFHILAKSSKKAFSLIFSGLKGLFAFLLSNPIILVFGLITVALVILWTKFDWFRNSVISVFENIKNFILPLWTTIKDSISSVITSLEPLIKSFSAMFQSLWDLIKSIFDAFSPHFQSIWNNITTFLGITVGIWESIFQSTWDKIKVIWDTVQPYFSILFNSIFTVASFTANTIGQVFSTAWEIVKVSWDLSIGFFKNIFDTITAIFSVIGAVLQGDFSTAWELIKSIVGQWKNYFSNVWSGIKTVFSKVGEFFHNTFSNAWNTIKSIFSNASSFFGNLWENIKHKFYDIAVVIGSAMNSAFRNAMNSLLSTAERVLNSPIKAINTAIGVLNKVTGGGIGRLGTFSLPRMETGGVLDRGARAIIAGENGAEAIVPLEKNIGWIKKVANLFTKELSVYEGVNTNYIYQTSESSYIDKILGNILDKLDAIINKSSDFYIDGKKVSSATAFTDDIASGNLLEKLERGLAV